VSVAACVGLLAIWTGVAEAARPRPRCVVYSCRTLFESTQVRVFQATTRHTSTPYYRRSFAEWRPNGRITPLGDYAFSVSMGPFAVAGRFIGYSLEEGEKEGPSIWIVRRVDVATGRGESQPAEGGPGNGFEPPNTGVADIVVTPAGTVAWITHGQTEHPSLYRVLELPAVSKMPVVLASATNIAPNSLAATPGYFYWTEGGVPRSASIK
jgi:hypothetical protein